MVGRVEGHVPERMGDPLGCPKSMHRSARQRRSEEQEEKRRQERGPRRAWWEIVHWNRDLWQPRSRKVGKLGTSLLHCAPKDKSFGMAIEGSTGGFGGMNWQLD